MGTRGLRPNLVGTAEQVAERIRAYGDARHNAAADPVLAIEGGARTHRGAGLPPQYRSTTRRWSAYDPPRRRRLREPAAHLRPPPRCSSRYGPNWHRDVEIDRHLIELNAIALDLAAALTKGENSAAVLAAPAGAGGSGSDRRSDADLPARLVSRAVQRVLRSHPSRRARRHTRTPRCRRRQRSAFPGDRYALRPLFAFFRAHTLPIGVYARAADSAAGRVTGQTLPIAIERAVTAAVAVLQPP